MKLPARGTKEDVVLREKLGFSDRPRDAAFVAERIGNLLLYSPISSTVNRVPGLSVDDCNFLQLFGKEDTWKHGAPGAMSLPETKVVAAKFLASGAFSEPERFFPALFASADTNSRISDIGEDMLKRATPVVSLEDSELVKRLYRIYLGEPGEDGSLPARPALQTKILIFLCKSKAASSFIAESTQIVREALTPWVGAQGHGDFRPNEKGLEASKLRNQVFAFTNWLARISSPSDMALFAPTLVGQLRKYIEGQGWPRPRTEEQLSAGELASRAYGYESIGFLAAASPEKLLIESNLELLRWLMTSLSEDPSGSETSLSIEHALSSVIGAFIGRSDADLETSLASLFLHHMSIIPNSGEDESNGIVRSTRYIAVRFANRCLPYANIDGRYIDVLALCGGQTERTEVLEEGKKGLDPYWYRMLNPQQSVRKSDEDVRKSERQDVDLPSFEPLVERLLGSETSWDLEKPHIVKAFVTSLAFCRCILMHEALVFVGRSPLVDTGWERNIDALLENDEDARCELTESFTKQLRGVSVLSRAIATYLSACFRVLVLQGVGDTSRAGEFLLEVCKLVPTSNYVKLSRDISKLQIPIFWTHKSARENASRGFGLVATLEDCPEDAVMKMLSTFQRRSDSWQQAVGNEVHQVHGSILAIAFYLSRAIRRGAQVNELDERISSLRSTCFTVLCDGKDKLLLDGIYIAISELSLHGLFSPQALASTQTEEVVKKLIEKSKEGNERAISALGHFAMQCTEDDDQNSTLNTITEQLCELHTVRQPEVQFAIGEALGCAAIGWQSKTLVSALDIGGPPPSLPPREHTLELVFSRILDNCKSTKPALRQATVIWLLCLVQFCGHRAEIQSRLRECQIAFKGFLSDRETLNQESASRGLTLVYEKGDKVLKDDLIRDLVGSFTGTTSSLAGTVSEDTELFDAGALPTGEGSVTTYKDIMSLASEVGDSSLVYRFMSLASHDAIWSSRAAFGRFGLSNILSDASTDGYLANNPKLYSALFRYRFDPNTNVRNAMNDIWSALVKDPAVTVNLHFDTIIKDLFKSILGKEWRTSQASCAAIADLVQGRPLETYETYLNDIWSLAFKVCDDIKESVRAAAMSLARVLTGILTRALEAGDASARTADKMLKQVLPFLLSTQGLESGAADVQNFSRKTILQIIKKSNGKTLRPFVPELVGRLLALLSSIEPEMINYVHMNAETFGVTKQELDDARLKHIRGSSMLEAIERCLDYLDEASMPELQNHLENAMKAVIGLPSKVGCSRVLVSLSTRQNFIFRPYADRFLPLAQKQCFDRNDTISSAYAAACGYMARLAGEDALMKLIDDCRRLYFDSEEDRQRMIAGDVIYAFSKYATDRFNSFAGEMLPFVFVAKHDQFDRAKTLFQDTWNENVGGSRAVLLYLKEIIQLVSQHLDSARWSVKHTSAFAVADVVMSAGTSISDVDARVIWPALEKALSGKTWEGKERVLKAFVQFCKNSDSLKQDVRVAEQAQKIMLRESKRSNVGYRQHALGCLADFVQIRKSIDLYEQIRDACLPVIDDMCDDSEEMDVDSVSGGPSSKTVKESTIANAVSAILRSVSPQTGASEQLVSRLRQCLEVIDKVIVSETGNKTIRAAIYDGLTDLFRMLEKSHMGSTLSAGLEDTLMEYMKRVLDAGEQVEQVRTKAAEAATSIAPVARRSARLREAFVRDLDGVKAQERSSAVRQALEKARKALGE